MSDGEWTWEFSSTAEDDLDGLSPADQDRIRDKLDEIVSSPWRDPPDYGEPLRNSPYKKIRVGEFRLSVSFRRDASGSSSHVSSAVAARTPPTMTK